jgi:hypothetical protein
MLLQHGCSTPEAGIRPDAGFAALFGAWVRTIESGAVWRSTPKHEPISAVCPSRKMHEVLF